MSGNSSTHIPYEERWEHLKPIIIDVFLGIGRHSSEKALTIPKLAAYMKEKHSFTAEAHQYRHRFQKWNIKKRTDKEEKEAIITAFGKRNRPGASISNVKLKQGKGDDKLMKPVDAEQMKRHLKRRLRHPPVEALSPGTFFHWDLPYTAYRSSIVKPMDHPSPFGHSANTPQYLDISSPEATTPGGRLAELTPIASLAQQKPINVAELMQPTSLCKWAIHLLNDIRYKKIPSPPQTTQAEFDLHDESSWTPWPLTEMYHRNLQASMQETFNQSRFSTISDVDLPISHDILKAAVAKSPEELELDAWAFAIMAGNLEPIEQMHDDVWGPSFEKIGAIFPFHLAASFMDGGHTCCLVMNSLIIRLQESLPIALNNLDSNGHTVLDSLMISVLRSHTDLAPFEVSESFRETTRFPGEEKDICGRWDADSPPIRQLHKAGHSRIPKQWKHSFCHSAAQARTLSTPLHQLRS
ncbi:hypothetical protein CT0861_06765 [Colletotrichum tofieldiae]|uniref:Clr5 domain-containing protein n=1 Tax=Colletotrichum tofieldiae TaxID=708197 RepID=A0A161VIY3_9PEZI|nr:hypothetical protein CT0861_06765 [Colletotrichum tofieldiae]